MIFTCYLFGIVRVCELWGVCARSQKAKFYEEQKGCNVMSLLVGNCITLGDGMQLLVFRVVLRKFAKTK